jgi:hypothetical protein
MENLPFILIDPPVALKELPNSEISPLSLCSCACGASIWVVIGTAAILQCFER